LETGEQQYIRPQHPEGKVLRFNWNAAIATSTQNTSTVYYGSQFVHKSVDNGQHWEIISPDLTTNDTSKQKSAESGGLTIDGSGAENYTTILAIAPSPLDEKVIWVSTDDGNIQLTRDGGQTWVKLNDRIKGLKKGAWMPQVKASKHKVGEAFLVVNDYRRDDWTPWLYRTQDFGKSWESIVEGNGVSGYVLSFEQDPVVPNLLFTGTEFGLFVSLDAGSSWNKWKGKYPTVSTYDLKIQAEAGDLVVGTFGRSIWILDDIRPLRVLAKEGASLLQRNIYSYPAADAYLFSRMAAAGTRFQGDAIFQGDDKSNGALITYSLKATSKQDTTIKSDTVYVKIFDANNTQIRKMITVGKQGMNRFTWDMCQAGYRSSSTKKPEKEIEDVSGRWVMPGKYSLQLRYGNDSVSIAVNVKKDPRMEISMETMQNNADNLDQILAYEKLSTTTIDQLNDATETIDRVLLDMKVQKVSNDSIQGAAKALKVKIKALKEQVNEKEDIQGFSDNQQLLSSRIWPANYYSQLYSKNNSTQQLVIDQIKTQLKGILDDANQFFGQDWKQFQEDVQKLELNYFKEINELKVEE
jgi:hypothetical protein